MYKIFIDEHSLNDATSCYISIIEEALRRRGTPALRTMELSALGAEDTVVVIECASFWKVWRTNRKQRIILWVQGIFPEETDLTYPSGLKQFLRKRYWRIKERIAIRKASFLLFVSEEMRRHYRRVYGYRGENHFVMPCFNMALDESAFTVPGKYNRPAFVYAGGLSAWQCIRQTLDIYREIAAIIPGSSLTLLTRQTEEARRLVAAAGLKQVEIRTVPLEQMPEEQKKYKYGFLLREDIEVNRVATPTKLNSYMASGIIPIMSDVMTSFRENLAGIRHIIRVPELKDCKAIAQSIARQEAAPVSSEQIRDDFRQAFEKFYNKEYYIQQLTDKLP